MPISSPRTGATYWYRTAGNYSARQCCHDTILRYTHSDSLVPTPCCPEPSWYIPVNYQSRPVFAICPRFIVFIKVGERLCEKLGGHADSNEVVDAKEIFGKMPPQTTWSWLFSTLVAICIIRYYRLSNIVEEWRHSLLLARKHCSQPLDPKTSPYISHLIPRAIYARHHRLNHDRHRHGQPQGYWRPNFSILSCYPEHPLGPYCPSLGRVENVRSIEIVSLPVLIARRSLPCQSLEDHYHHLRALRWLRSFEQSLCHRADCSVVLLLWITK